MSLERFARKEVITLPPDATLAEVAEVMRERHVGAIVITEIGRPIGIVTDRDLVLRGMARGLGVETPVNAVMSFDLIVTRLDALVDEVLFTMRKSGVRRLPIVDREGLLAGIVTLDDILVLLSGELSCGVEAVLENRGP